MRDRIRMALNGLVVVTILLDENDDLVGEPWCETGVYLRLQIQVHLWLIAWRKT